ncbi:MAG: decarboxylating 6-phosphogluconate dehydrogenase [Chloroflexi bacterium]|nr:MAG: decarboxylating 6-phosphogluconate dehydrogenase [Chloroflexota bacterium]
MQIAMIGLGRMGGNMATRLLKGGHQVVAYARRPEVVAEKVKEGADGTTSLGELMDKLSLPRSVWLMVPAGEATEEIILSLMEMLSPGDTIIDGGNSNYKDSIRRAALVKTKGIDFVDVGTSGGIWGLKEGYSLMIGGDEAPVKRHFPIFQTLAPASDRGWAFVGPSGSGHFVKMIHNGIEYGMMQAFAEGFEIMKAKKAFNLDLYQIAECWRFGSVVRSWLLDLTADLLKPDPTLTDLIGYVTDSGEGRWTVFEAIDLDVSAPVITLSLQNRLRSREADPFGNKLLAGLRNQFGGHAVRHAEQREAVIPVSDATAERPTTASQS